MGWSACGLLFVVQSAVAVLVEVWDFNPLGLREFGFVNFIQEDSKHVWLMGNAKTVGRVPLQVDRYSPFQVFAFDEDGIEGDIGNHVWMPNYAVDLYFVSCFPDSCYPTVLLNGRVHCKLDFQYYGSTSTDVVVDGDDLYFVAYSFETRSNPLVKYSLGKILANQCNGTALYNSTHAFWVDHATHRLASLDPKGVLWQGRASVNLSEVVGGAFWSTVTEVEGMWVVAGHVLATKTNHFLLYSQELGLLDRLEVVHDAQQPDRRDSMVRAMNYQVVERVHYILAVRQDTFADLIRLAGRKLELVQSLIKIAKPEAGGVITAVNWIDAKNSWMLGGDGWVTGLRLKRDA